MAPLQRADHVGLLSGGLRYAATTGYYLKALQAEIRSLRFSHTHTVAPGAKVTFGIKEIGELKLQTDNYLPVQII